MPREIDIPLEVLPHAEGLPLPAYETPQAAGMDLRAAIDADKELLPGARWLCPTGLRVAIPDGLEGQVRPRSGLAIRHGLTCPNAPGTIDADYRGELCVPLQNLGDAPLTITRGMRVAQLVIAPVLRARWQQADSLDETARGSGGFGSTGA